MGEGETLHGPAVIAALLRAAFEEGAAVVRDETPLEVQWNASKAKAAAGQILANAADPTRAERLLGLYREWANSAPIDGDYKAAWDRACRLMKQMHELIGDAPFDTDTRRPRGSTNG